MLLYAHVVLQVVMRACSCSFDGNDETIAYVHLFGRNAVIMITPARMDQIVRY